MQRPSGQDTPYHYDAPDYHRQPDRYGPPHASNVESGSGNQNGRYAEYMNPAESRPASFDSDNHHSSKKPRLGLDQSGQYRPQYDGSYASQHPPPPGLSSAGPPSSTHPYSDPGDYGSNAGDLPRQTSQRSLAPRAPENTSLPRFPVPIMEPSPSYSSPAPPPQAPYQAPSSSYPTRLEMQNSAFPSPPLVSPLNGSPYSRRESTFSGGVPAVPSPSSSHSSARDDGRAKQYSGHGQNQGAQYFTSAPSPNGPYGPPPLPPKGTPFKYNGQPPTGPMPQKLPPMQRPHPADGQARERQYPYHDVPYSSGPMQFQFSQPYNTVSQQLAPTLPSDFEEREAYCDSRGVIVRSAQKESGHRYNQHRQYQGHPEQYQQHQHQHENPAAGYQPYEQQHGQYYKQDTEQQHEHPQNETFRQQQNQPQGPRQYDEQYCQRPGYQQSQENHEPDKNYQNDPNHERYEYVENHHPGYAPNEQYATQNGSENVEHMVDEEDVSGWEPEIKPKDIETEESKGDSAEETSDSVPANGQGPESTTAPEPAASLPASVESSPPAPSRAAPLQALLHPVDQTPLLRAAEIPVRTAFEPLAVPSIIPPPAEEVAILDQPSESAKGGKPERRQRGTFTQEQRDETSQTRTYGACLRCKSQRVRVSLRNWVNTFVCRLLTHV